MNRSWDELIQRLVKAGILQTPRVTRALRMVPRGLFLPESERRYASIDTPLPIGDGQTISAPLD